MMIPLSSVWLLYEVNQLSGHWPCVESYLAGGIDKYIFYEVLVRLWLLFQKIDSLTRVQILNEAVFISHNVNVTDKCINPTTLLLSKLPERLGSLTLLLVIDLGEGKLSIQASSTFKT